MNTEERKIEKLKELLSYYIKMTREIKTPYVLQLKSEIEALESQPSEQKHETAEIKSAKEWFFERYPKEAEGVSTVLLFEIMREYADYVSQFQKKMSDEEIEEEGRKHYNSFIGAPFSVRFIAWCTGARFVRDKLNK